jgi:hypothetical protein
MVFIMTADAPKILFVTDGTREADRVAVDLSKTLWPDYACDTVRWQEKIDPPAAFAAKYDLFFATPNHCMQLKAMHGIPYDKMVALAQVDSDIFPAMQYMQNSLRGFAVTSGMLRDIAFACGVARVPAVLPVGVYYANYAQPTGENLQRLIWLSDDDAAKSRYDLGERVAEAVGLPLVSPQRNCHFLVSEALYKSGDLGIFCALINTPYAALEALAAGAPVLGTETGIFADMAESGGVGPLPFEADALVANAVEVIRALQNNPELYQRMSYAAATVGREYDWAVLRQPWLEFLQSL